ncbi:hypothetical protein C8A05DRAFT_15565 [Staphylotrichum tortipilum]|uniref:Uncharacterized protein n=1 Tax=Staphylotrichum tortipilum TaxID=2831512 RepID=A0AAN6RTX6_9PEZI|nr:hypothetical protein C8A05DRAFT_15565 [Staphylotrichum longicolle]
MRKIFSHLALSTRLRKRAGEKPKQATDGTGTSRSRSRSQPKGAGHHDTIPVVDHALPPPNTLQPPQHPPKPDPAPDQDTTAPTLESLPAELRRLILARLVASDDIGGLRALVSASPVFFQQYLLDRKTLLRATLKHARGIPLADAYALQTSARLYSQPPGSDPDAPCELTDPEDVRCFVDGYQALRKLPGEVILAEHCSEEDLVGMVAFYEAVAKPLAPVCAAQFLRRLKPAPEMGTLSVMEVARLLRGLYRFQIYCNLFGQGAKGRRNAPPLEFAGEQLELFFCLFEPWEVDEIYCVYVLVRDMYGWVLDRTEVGGNGEKVGFEDWKAPLAGSKKDLRNDPVSAHRCSLLEGAALRGLVPFYRLVREDDDEKMAGMLEAYLVPGSGNIEHALGRPNQAARRRRHPMDGDGSEAAWTRLIFYGDVENGPPLAWVIYWKGRYVNRYGDALEPSVQRWGHVFWDNKRLVKSQGLEELLCEREVFRRW